VDTSNPTMKAVLLAIVLCGLAAVANAGANWNGAWTDQSNARVGGTLYTCVRGNSIYGVFSKAGWIQGNVVGVRATGTWYIAGDPFDDRDRLWGVFDLSILDDNSGFRGEWYYGDRAGRAYPWIESRLAAPAPVFPDDTLCLVPNLQSAIIGVFHGGIPATDLFICREFVAGTNGDRVFGSFTNPDFSGSIEGYTADNGVSFFGFYYTEDRAGGLFLRSVDANYIRGFRWAAEPTRALLSTASEQVFARKPQKVSVFQCNTNEVFTPSSAATLAAGVMLSAVAAVVALF